MGGKVMKDQLLNIINSKIHHHCWSLTYKRLYTSLAFAQPCDVFCLIGPSRSGKSSVMRQVAQEVTDRGNDESVGNSISLIATNCSTDGRFSTKAFTINALTAINHPFYSFNIDSLGDDVIKLTNRLSRTNETALRTALEASLKHHKIKYLIIDEVQHVLYCKSKGSTTPRAILDSWKSLAQECKLTLILIGTYEVLNLVLTSTHLIGRTSFIHMPRYKNSQEELPHFKEILTSYDHLLGIEHNLLSSNLKFIYEHTLGCIGHLNKWLRRALEESIVLNKPIDMEILKFTRRTKNELDSILEEIQLGELMYLQSKKTIGKRARSLGIKIGFLRFLTTRPLHL